MTRLPLWLGCAVAGLVARPAGGADIGPASGSDEEALVRLHAEIVQLIAEPSCANLVHCRVLPLGSNPCGGPSEYLAYSSTVSNRELLEAKAYEYSFLEEEVNRKRAVAGTCHVLQEPRAVCIDQRCRLAPHER